jgi:hypothetical protein
MNMEMFENFMREVDEMSVGEVWQRLWKSSPGEENNGFRPLSLKEKEEEAAIEAGTEAAGA